MENKGNEFKGVAAGGNYKRWAALLGFTEKFYKKGIGNKTFTEPIKALDLGCGPGALSYALAEKLYQDSELTGIDISNDQLEYASIHAPDYPCKMEFINCSMDKLTFPNQYFDLVVTSMALHETPPQVRRKAIEEVGRVLKPEGEFILIDWSKPRFGFFAAIWFLMLCFGKNNQDNWQNAYPALCANAGMELVEDSYINSIARRQVFKKNKI